ncbi:MAG: hypothetical protein IKH58_07325 [Bacteroidales bacterium]|nr:hypothetical protein [Bacteroidales bacterium]
MNKSSISQIIDASKNDGFALAILGTYCINTQKNVETGAKFIFGAADHNNVIWAKNLQFYLRRFKQWELPIEHHALVDNDAIEQLKIYVGKGNMWAMTILGSLYYWGNVVAQNRKDAADLLYWAAQDGCFLAKELLQEYGLHPQNPSLSDIVRKFTVKDNSKFWIKD